MFVEGVVVLKISEKTKNSLLCSSATGVRPVPLSLLSTLLGCFLATSKIQICRSDLKKKSSSGDLRTLLAKVNTLLEIGQGSQVILSLTCL